MSDDAKQQLAGCDADFDLSWIDLVWPDNLGSCLAIAGALCAAWYQGNRYALQEHVLRGWVTVEGFDWTPGCGRAAVEREGRKARR